MANPTTNKNEDFTKEQPGKYQHSFGSGYGVASISQQQRESDMNLVIKRTSFCPLEKTLPPAEKLVFVDMDPSAQDKKFANRDFAKTAKLNSFASMGYATENQSMDSYRHRMDSSKALPTSLVSKRQSLFSPEKTSPPESVGMKIKVCTALPRVLSPLTSPVRTGRRSRSLSSSSETELTPEIKNWLKEISTAPPSLLSPLTSPEKCIRRNKDLSIRTDPKLTPVLRKVDQGENVQQNTTTSNNRVEMVPDMIATLVDLQTQTISHGVKKPHMKKRSVFSPENTPSTAGKPVSVEIRFSTTSPSLLSPFTSPVKISSRSNLSNSSESELKPVTKKIDQDENVMRDTMISNYRIEEVPGMIATLVSLNEKSTASPSLLSISTDPKVTPALGKINQDENFEQNNTISNNRVEKEPDMIATLADLQTQTASRAVNQPIYTSHLKRRSLFSPEKTPPPVSVDMEMKVTTPLPRLLSPLTSPVDTIRRSRSLSSSSEGELTPDIRIWLKEMSTAPPCLLSPLTSPSKSSSRGKNLSISLESELKPVMKKIDLDENAMREIMISNNRTEEVHDMITTLVDLQTQNVSHCVKKQIPTPHMKKRSLFSPEKIPSPTGKLVPVEFGLFTDLPRLLSPLISPAKNSSRNNLSNSSESDLKPVTNKIDRDENDMRDTAISNYRIEEVPDMIATLVPLKEKSTAPPSLLSPAKCIRRSKNLSISTDPEVTPPLRKIDHDENFEQNTTISNNRVEKEPDMIATLVNLQTQTASRAVNQPIYTSHLKRRSLFSPEKTPPPVSVDMEMKVTTPLPRLLSPLTSPVDTIRRSRSLSSSSEGELTPEIRIWLKEMSTAPPCLLSPLTSPSKSSSRGNNLSISLESELKPVMREIMISNNRTEEVPDMNATLVDLQTQTVIHCVKKPHMKKRSLFSPKKIPSPAGKPVSEKIRLSAPLSLLSPLTSPAMHSSRSNLSNSSEFELKPVTKKIEQDENVMRDTMISNNRVEVVHDMIATLVDLQTQTVSHGVNQQIPTPHLKGRSLFSPEKTPLPVSVEMEMTSPVDTTRRSRSLSSSSETELTPEIKNRVKKMSTAPPCLLSPLTSPSKNNSPSKNMSISSESMEMEVSAAPPSHLSPFTSPLKRRRRCRILSSSSETEPSSMKWNLSLCSPEKSPPLGDHQTQTVSHCVKEQITTPLMEEESLFSSEKTPPPAEKLISMRRRRCRILSSSSETEPSPMKRNLSLCSPEKSPPLGDLQTQTVSHCVKEQITTPLVEEQSLFSPERTSPPAGKLISMEMEVFPRHLSPLTSPLKRRRCGSILSSSSETKLSPVKTNLFLGSPEKIPTLSSSEPEPTPVIEEISLMTDTIGTTGVGDERRLDKRHTTDPSAVKLSSAIIQPGDDKYTDHHHKSKKEKKKHKKKNRNEREKNDKEKHSNEIHDAVQEHIIIRIHKGKVVSGDYKSSGCHHISKKENEEKNKHKQKDKIHDKREKKKNHGETDSKVTNESVTEPFKEPIKIRIHKGKIVPCDAKSSGHHHISKKDKVHDKREKEKNHRETDTKLINESVTEPSEEQINIRVHKGKIVSGDDKSSGHHSSSKKDEIHDKREKEKNHRETDTKVIYESVIEPSEEHIKIRIHKGKIVSGDNKSSGHQHISKKENKKKHKHKDRIHDDHGMKKNNGENNSPSKNMSISSESMEMEVSAAPPSHLTPFTSPLKHRRRCRAEPRPMKRNLSLCSPEKSPPLGDHQTQTVSHCVKEQITTPLMEEQSLFSPEKTPPPAEKLISMRRRRCRILSSSSETEPSPMKRNLSLCSPEKSPPLGDHQTQTVSHCVKEQITTPLMEEQSLFSSEKTPPPEQINIRVHKGKIVSGDDKSSGHQHISKKENKEKHKHKDRIHDDHGMKKNHVEKESHVIHKSVTEPAQEISNIKIETDENKAASVASIKILKNKVNSESNFELSKNVAPFPSVAIGLKIPHKEDGSKKRDRDRTTSHDRPSSEISKLNSASVQPDNVKSSRHHYKAEKKNEEKYKHKDKKQDECKRKQFKEKDSKKHRSKECASERAQNDIQKDKIVVNAGPASCSTTSTELRTKLKIPKEMMSYCPNLESGSKKRNRDRMTSPEGPPSKIFKNKMDHKISGRQSSSMVGLPAKPDTSFERYSILPDDSVAQPLRYSVPSRPAVQSNLKAPPPHLPASTFQVPSLRPPPPPPTLQQRTYPSMPCLPNMSVPPSFMYNEASMYQYYNQGYMYQPVMNQYQQMMVPHPSYPVNPPLPIDEPPKTPPLPPLPLLPPPE